MNEDLLNRIKDICQRVFRNSEVQLSLDEMQSLLMVQLKPSVRQDALTQSQQEMDLILSVQHLLGNQQGDKSWEMKLVVL